MVSVSDGGPVCTPSPTPANPPAGVQDSLRVWPEEGACAVAAAVASETGSQLRLGLLLGEGKEGMSFFLPLGTFVSLFSPLTLSGCQSPRFSRAGTWAEKA